MTTLNVNKPIPRALFDLRPLVGPVAWSLLTALIENEYRPDPEPLSVETLAEMTRLGKEEAALSLWWMQDNSFIPVQAASAVSYPAGRFRLDLDKTSQHLMATEGE